jgi:alkylation response protein AidB-like acyl-CoA dehydrogenase
LLVHNRPVDAIIDNCNGHEKSEQCPPETTAPARNDEPVEPTRAQESDAAPPMDFELTPEQQHLQREIYDYLDKLVTPALLAELLNHSEGGSPEEAPEYIKCLHRLGDDGWLGIGWPKEYGGQGKGPIEQYIFFDAVSGYHALPIPMLTLNAVGPTIMQVGTPQQKDRFLPRILKGRLNIGIGYTEPGAGSDLASLRTTAVRDGDDYVINGQKVFTTLAHFCDYIWLAARTDPAAKKHKGISIFLVDTKSPGFKVDPMHIMGGFRSNITYYDDVRVPKDCLIGQENAGWNYINMQLAMERIGLVPHSRAGRMVGELVRWVKQTTLDGARRADVPWVRTRLAELARDTEVLKLMNYRVAWQIAQGTHSIAEAAMTKIFGSELFQRVHGFGMQMMGLLGQLEPGDELAPLGGKFEREYLAKMLLTFGGGANEVLRDVVALTGLGMPRSR